MKELRDSGEPITAAGMCHALGRTRASVAKGERLREIVQQAKRPKEQVAALVLRSDRALSRSR